jgi:hypothetical protein
MKTLDDLTPEIRAKFPEYISRSRDPLLSGEEYKNYERETITSYIKKVFELSGHDEPVVVVADDVTQFRIFYNWLLQSETILSTLYMLKNNPFALKQVVEDKMKDDDNPTPGFHSSDLLEECAEELALEMKDILVDTKLPKEKIEQLCNEVRYLFVDQLADKTEKEVKVPSHWVFECSVYSRDYYTLYKFLVEEFKMHDRLKPETLETLNWFYDHKINNIGRCYFAEGVALVLRIPEVVHVNEEGQLHNAHGPALSWNGGKNPLYYLNGRSIEPELFQKAYDMSLTVEDFRSFTNEEDRAAVASVIQEAHGHDKFMEFIGVTMIDEQEIIHPSGHKEVGRLYRGTQSFAHLQDHHGNQNQPYAYLEMTCPSTGQTYTIETSAAFTDVVDAFKFHRPAPVPESLEYEFEVFNN